MFPSSTILYVVAKGVIITSRIFESLFETDFGFFTE
ncbi:hypothetical protein LTAR_01369 [Leptolinea tardivitalis]|nr:hypothetical protein LTAR_01369 [Leptolinea tardivitalis]